MTLNKNQSGKQKCDSSLPTISHQAVLQMFATDAVFIQLTSSNTDLQNLLPTHTLISMKKITLTAKLSLNRLWPDTIYNLKNLWLNFSFPHAMLQHNYPHLTRHQKNSLQLKKIKNHHKSTSILQKKGYRRMLVCFFFSPTLIPFISLPVL